MSKQFVYQIYCNNKDECDFVYVGSTCNFTRRKYQHKQNCKNKDNLKVYQTINEYGGWDNWTMEILEELNIERVLEEKEEEWRVKLNAQLNSQKAYSEQNKEKIKEQRKEQYENNKEKIREKQAEYREENREKINEKKKLKVQCNCGAIFRKEDKVRHFRTVVHKNFVSSNPDVEINLEPLEIS